MAVPDRMDECLRVLGLVEAQRMARSVFAGATARGLITPGSGEREAGHRIGDLARRMFGTAVSRSAGIVRSGPHTILPRGQEPPDRVIREDDMVVTGLGPLLTGYASDFARTLALGDDPGGHRLVEDLATVFAAVRTAFHADSAITGGQLYAEVQALAGKAGWALGGEHAGRLVGTAPTADARHADPASFLCPDNDEPLRRTTEGGWRAHWILEIRLVDEDLGRGGWFVDLLDLA
ncbi:M24 family metallopeptidase [Streptomyces sp. SID161]|uniref:M24 family metallopeptidase n=1 Tax=Streptomyces sp. SID161 TaxID=2690251 RepID=UPI001F2D1C94|nr:M24 family metallopeptidase [Streptomyces sp. SID161]